MPGTPITPGLLGGDAARHLVAHHLDGLGRRADEGHAPLGDGPGEVGVLGEEPVARVHAVGPRLVDHLEDPLGVEVALGGGLPAEREGLVGQAHVQRLPVELGVHRHRGDAHLLAGADDADGDLAPVGDEDLGEHGHMVTCVPGGRARSVLAGGPGARFADVRWVDETGSTNADAMELARQGEPEGIVLVADHQTAGRGRAGRTWTAPPGAGLLLSVLLRPPAPVVDLATMAVAVSAAAAVESVAGFAPRLKWPNDLVWPGDGSAPDRKLAGILAEADWPAGSAISAGWKEPAAARPGGGRRRHRHQRGLAGRPARTSSPTSRWRSTTSSHDAGRSRGPADRAARRSSARATTRSSRASARRCSPSGGRGRRRSVAWCGSTSAPTTSRARRSTSPTKATSSSRRSRAHDGCSRSATSCTSADRGGPSSAARGRR